MAKKKFVTRIYEVSIPDDREMVERHVNAAMGNDEDTAITMGSDNAIAIWLSYQYDVGNYTDNVEILDVQVSDLQPDVEEFELNEEE
jgi:hypothetical protein